MTKDDFLLIQGWAEDCIKAKAHIDSHSAFALISKIAKEAAYRGQRKGGAATPVSVGLASEALNGTIRNHSDAAHQ